MVYRKWQGKWYLPYKAKECIEDILEKTTIKSNKVQEHLRLLGNRINTVSF